MATACFSSSSSRALIDSCKLTRGLVDLDNLGVDLLAGREPIGALLASIARQLGLADDAWRTIADPHLDAAVEYRGHGAGHHLPFLQLGQASLEGIIGELLDAQADPLLLDIDVEHLGADDVAAS